MSELPSGVANRPDRGYYAAMYMRYLPRIGALCATLILFAAHRATAAEASPALPGDIPSSAALDELLAYTPTGDALWDTYAQALLAALRDPQTDLHEHGAPFIADEVMDRWEAQFGSDPRYWQLRCFEAQRTGNSKPGNGPGWFLVEGERHGAADAATQWAAYILLDDGLRAQAAIQPSTHGDPARKKALDALIASYPGESAPCYARAFLKGQAQDWDGMLADLELGNAAARNRQLLPFPLSFVVERVRQGQPLGSDVAAGIVTANSFVYQFSGANRMMTSKIWKSFVVEAPGGPSGRAQVMHGFCCRLATMKGGWGLQPIQADYCGSLLTSHLLTAQNVALSSDQRLGLLQLYNRWHHQLNNLLHDKIHCKEPLEKQYLSQALTERDISAGDLAKYVLDGDPAGRLDQFDDFLPDYAKEMDAAGSSPEAIAQSRKLFEDLLVGNPTYRLPLTLAALRAQFAVEHLRFELVTAAPEIAQQVEFSSHFDWDKLAFPEDQD